ncbi:MAG: Dickkopf N-terminal cysteine-rich domain-containing protein [Candidatus Bilamarchaeaceae archaeon]
MKMNLAVLPILLLFGVVSAQVGSEGGNVTQLNASSSLNSTYWDGLYGDVILGSGLNYTHIVMGNNIIELNVVAQNPPCTYSSITMHIIAVNSSLLTTPLSPGNLTLLDAFVGGSAENGTRTFTSTSTFTLTYGTIASVPTTYTYAGNVSSIDFREGYLNDANGNLVFVAVVVSDRPDWNGTTSDYQIMLPNNGAPTNYTLWVDVGYTCQNVTPPPPGRNRHALYIYPPGSFAANAGSTFNPNFIVKNIGDYVERDIAVYIETCPLGFICGTDTIARLGEGDEGNASFPITVDGIGEYVLTVCARNDNAHACADFIVQVTEECERDNDCGEDEYCDDGVCKPKKKVREECKRDGECESGVCSNGICVYCTSNEDCAFNEICAEGICKKIECPCGEIRNHTCIPYRCCADEDCNVNEFCIDHSCVAKELEILVVSGEIVENESILVQIVNNKDEPVPAARVFTDYITVYADENGFATIPAPYNGLVYASKETYPQTGLLLHVIHIGFFVVEDEIIAGQETRIRLVDSAGRGIAGALVHIGEDIVTTDDEGYFRYTFRSSGKVVLKGSKIGYRINDKEITVVEGPTAACYFPVLLNLLTFTSSSLYILWLIALVLALLNFGLSARRIKARPMLKAALYSFIPVILALPGAGVFSICAMANVILLQSIIETAIAVRNMLRPKSQKEE